MAADETPPAEGAPSDSADSREALEAVGEKLMGLLGSDEQQADAQAVANAHAEAKEPEWWSVHIKESLPITVDGEEHRATLEELMRDYSGRAASTQRFQAASEMRKRAELEAREAAETRRRYLAGLAEIQQAVASWPDGSTIDWAQAAQALTPEEYAVLHGYHTNIELARQETERRLVQAEAEDRTYQEQERASRLAAERDKLNATLGWSDPEKAVRDQAALRKYLAAEGWSDEEIGSLSDSRQVVSHYRAMCWQESSQRPEVRLSKPRTRTVVPGGASAPTDGRRTSRSRDMQRLRSSGKISDAAKVFMHDPDL